MSTLRQEKVGWPFAKAVTVYASAGAKAFSGVQFEGGKDGAISSMSVVV